MTEIHVVMGQSKSGKSLVAMKEAILLQGKLEGEHKKPLFMVSEERGHLTVSYLTHFEKVTGMKFSPNVNSVLSIKDAIKSFNTGEFTGGVLFLEDFDLLNRFRENQGLQEDEIEYISKFQYVVMPIQMGMDRLINYDQKGLLEYLKSDLKVEEIHYKHIVWDIENERPVVHAEYSA